LPGLVSGLASVVPPTKAQAAKVSQGERRFIFRICCLEAAGDLLLLVFVNDFELRINDVAFGLFP
jgi:hypothetical protein